MARLASETKMGFYATSVETIDKVIEKTVEIEEGTFALDACCGEGTVIEHFKTRYGCYNFGVELNDNRAQDAQKRQIDRVLCADAINGVRKSNRWAGFQFLNPPYDYGADGERLELKFIERWGLCTIEGGVLMLVVNPSSADEDMAKKLILQGYRPLVSLFCPDNDDYKKFGQFFIVLKRVHENYRFDIDEFMAFLEEPMDINEVPALNKIVCKRGRPYQMFKEITLPQWKKERVLSKSRLKKHFFDGLRKGTIEGGSIEHPNEGQAAILAASGALNKRIATANGDEVILKGTVQKIRSDLPQMNDDGDITRVRRVDSFQTVVYMLNCTEGAYYKLT